MVVLWSPTESLTDTFESWVTQDEGSLDYLICVTRICPLFGGSVIYATLTYLSPKILHQSQDQLALVIVSSVIKMTTIVRPHQVNTRSTIDRDPTCQKSHGTGFHTATESSKLLCSMLATSTSLTLRCECFHHYSIPCPPTLFPPFSFFASISLYLFLRPLFSYPFPDI